MIERLPAILLVDKAVCLILLNARWLVHVFLFISSLVANCAFACQPNCGPAAGFDPMPCFSQGCERLRCQV